MPPTMRLKINTCVLRSAILHPIISKQIAKSIKHHDQKSHYHYNVLRTDLFDQVSINSPLCR